MAVWVINASEMSEIPETWIRRPLRNAPPSERCVESQTHRRGRRNGHHDLAIALEGDQRRPRLIAADKAPGPVDRVHHPPPGGVAIADDAELLADERVVGPLIADALADVGLDRPICLGHGGEVRLRVDLEVVSPEPLHRDSVGHVSELEGEREIVCHRG